MYTNPSEKYESTGMMTFPIEWKNKIQVPNHQPARDVILIPTHKKRKFDQCHWLTMFTYHTINIWLMVSPPLKNMKVNWEDDIRNKSHVPNHQPDMIDCD